MERRPLLGFGGPAGGEGPHLPTAPAEPKRGLTPLGQGTPRGIGGSRLFGLGGAKQACLRTPAREGVPTREEGGRRTQGGVARGA